MAIDPGAIDDRDAFVARLERLIDQITHAPLIPDAPGPVLYPGQPESERARQQQREGIVIDQEHYNSLSSLAQKFGIPFPAS